MEWEIDWIYDRNSRLQTYITPPFDFSRYEYRAWVDRGRLILDGENGVTILIEDFHTSRETAVMIPENVVIVGSDGTDGREYGIHIDRRLKEVAPAPTTYTYNVTVRGNLIAYNMPISKGVDINLNILSSQLVNGSNPVIVTIIGSDGISVSKSFNIKCFTDLSLRGLYNVINS